MATEGMTAVLMTAQGPAAKVLHIVNDAPKPKRGPGEVLVRLVGTSVNPVDVKIRSGELPEPTVYPKILGGDVAGLVEEADENSKFKKGDNVFALTYGYWYGTQEGSYAEYAVVSEDFLAYAPSSIPLSQAGGVPLAALTAWQALDTAHPQPGQRLLILAGAGGVGHFALQVRRSGCSSSSSSTSTSSSNSRIKMLSVLYRMAKQVYGLHVVATAGPANLDFVKQLGADEVIDYTKQKWQDTAKDEKYDIIIDMLPFPGTTEQCIAALKPTGHYSHIQNYESTDKQLLKCLEEQHHSGQGPSVSLIVVTPNGQQLQWIADLMDEGRVKLVVHQVYPLKDIAKAHDHVAAGHTRGKVVVTIDPSA
eukprot:jgi/Chrzof1/9797/Cz04g16010.t1